jgi:hypothetical protein
MKTLVFVVIGIVSGLVLLVGVVALLGSRLPKAHVASRSIMLHRSPQEVYSFVRAGGPAVFREDGVNYAVVKDVPGELLITRIVDTDLPYSGQWTYTFAPESGGTRVTIREDGEVSNVIFRFMSRYVFGHTATIDSYLNSLAKDLGEDTTDKP